MIKNGFTLMEMLAVIGLLALLIILVTPSIVYFVTSRYDEVDEIETALIEHAVRLYVEENPRDYPLFQGNRYCLLLEDIVSDGLIAQGFVENSEKYDITNILQVEVDDNKLLNIKIDHNCQEYYSQEFFRDESGAPAPLLLDNLIPIVGSESGFVKADLTEEWYDYDDKQWANAVLLKDEAFEDYHDNAGMLIDDNDVLGYFVWIPRYRYQLFNVAGDDISKENIVVKFESSRSVRAHGTEDEKWLTHPAFTFGETDLNGFWFGKFTTTGSFEDPTILPGETMLQNDNLYDNFLTGENFSNNIAVLDARLARNLEWAAVALLSRSVYGNDEVVWNNANNNLLTGCAGDQLGASSSSVCNEYDTTVGVNASTTGNVYGVYDMSGGVYESVMNGMLDLNEEVLLKAESEFDNINALPAKYIDKYPFGITSDDNDAYSRRILGDATAETRGWDGSSQIFITDNNPFFLRGGNIDNHGIFSFDNSAGDVLSGFRMVLSEE